jgi:hypothetical protein
LELLRSDTENEDYRIPRQKELSAVRGVELMLPSGAAATGGGGR